MGTYQALEDPTAFLRTADSVVIHADPLGLDSNYVAFKAWLAAGNTPDPRAAASLPDQGDTMLAAKLALGIAVTSSSTPALNATYAMDDASTADIYQIGLFCAQFGAFPSSTASQVYPDIDSLPHTFTVPQFVALLRAVATLVTKLSTQAAVMGQGGTPTWPAQTAVIP